MKLLLWLIVLGVAVSFGWGWVEHVKDGSMTTAAYSQWYLNQAQELAGKLKDMTVESISKFSQPMHQKTYQDDTTR